jgi:hypothetical protein
MLINTIYIRLLNYEKKINIQVFWIKKYFYIIFLFSDNLNIMTFTKNILNTTI